MPLVESTESSKEIPLIGNLSNRAAYDYTEEDARKITKALLKELDVMRARFEGSGKGIFSLSAYITKHKPIALTDHMDEKISRRLALALIAAESAADVKALLADNEAKYYFDNPTNWSPYGNREKNWDTVGNQQTNPVGALVELIINGEDAILLRKAKENNISDPRGAGAPRSMFDAVKRFFPHVNEGKIQKLSPAQRTALAEACIRIGIRRAARSNSRYPSYVVIDSGCGQHPEDFPKTFLSLGEKNKEGIPFVQGKFNMGSTGSLRFCTRSDIRDGHYKLIVSRTQGSEYWGWTLVRVRAPIGGEQLPVAEYFRIYP